MEQKILKEKLEHLISWLESYRNNDGEYYGFVIHRTEAKRMRRIHDTAWTQAAMVRGYSNLYRKSKEDRWYKSMISAADKIINNYDNNTGKILHTGHEDERFQSLVHCALALCALLDIIDLIDDSRKIKYINVSVEHVNKYWLEKLWVKNEGAFKFSEIDFYSKTEDRFVVNFNTMATEALIKLGEITKCDMYIERALDVGKWIISKWDSVVEYNNKLNNSQITSGENLNSDLMPLGGFPYQFTQNYKQPDNYITLYTGLSLRGIYALYRITQNPKFAEIIFAQSNFLLNMRDSETKLFYHTTSKGKIVKYPLFVSGAGMTLLGLHEVMPLIGTKALAEDTLKYILNCAYANGSYPSFMGKNLFRKNGKSITVWEDVVATTNWNAQLFEYLTRLIENPSTINSVKLSGKVIIFKKNFFYADLKSTVIIISWWPLKSAGFYVYKKKASSAYVSIYPLEVYGKIRALFEF